MWRPSAINACAGARAADEHRQKLRGWAQMSGHGSRVFRKERNINDKYSHMQNTLTESPAITGASRV
jgi:hypothetical protein